MEDILNKANEYILLHNEREEAYNEGNSEQGLEIDMQLVSLGFDLAVAITEIKN